MSMGMTKTKKRNLTLVFVFFALVGIALWIYQKNYHQKIQFMNHDILMYAAQPHFTSSDFLGQLTSSQAKLEIYNVKEGMVYFSMPSDETGETIRKLTKGPNRVQYAQRKNENLVLGDYILKKQGVCFMRFPAEDFSIDSHAKTQVQFSKIVYDISTAELSDYIANKSIYGGYLNFKVKQYWRFVKTISNHGALVAKPKEPSLMRLAQKITQDSQDNEERAQKLLDFVSEEIEYDGREASWDFETLKRPCEVLMSKKSDCSGLAILYASLLEQMGIDYYLIYIPGHITLAVLGNFNNENGLAYNIFGKTYFIAEPTSPGFVIGISPHDAVEEKGISFVQKPNEPSKITDAKTGKLLEYLE